MRAHSIWTLTAICITAVACSKNDPDAPGEPTGWLDGDQVVFDSPGGEVRVDALRVLVKEVVLDADTDERSVSRSIGQTRDCDVMAAVCEPEMPIIELEAGVWFDLYFGVEIDDSVAGRDALELEGTFSGDAGETPFVFLFDSGEVFEIERARLELEAPLAVNAGRMFHPSRWFETVDLNATTADGDGVIRITESSNQAQYDTMADALDRSLRGVFEDGTFEVVE